MKLTALSLTALASSVFAQDESPYPISSSPFRLILSSDNKTIDGTLLGGCHQGAAIESLCVTTQTQADPVSWYTTFTHNVSTSSTSNAIDTTGILAFTLQASGNLQVPSAMELSINPTSNIAVPIFYPGYKTFSSVQFDEEGKMYITAYQNDFATPPEPTSPSWKIYGWYVCLTRWAYTYETLAWKVGMDSKSPPQNPTCRAVNVTRVYI